MADELWYMAAFGDDDSVNELVLKEDISFERALQWAVFARLAYPDKRLRIVIEKVD